MRRSSSCWRNTPTWKQRHGYVMTSTAITLVVVAMSAFYSLQIRAMHDQHHVGWVRQPQPQPQPQQHVPIFHVGHFDLRLHINKSRNVTPAGSMDTVSQSGGGWHGHDSSRVIGSSVLTQANNRTVDITIPHGGDTSTKADVCVNAHAQEHRYTSDVHTDLSNVARKIVQDFKTELLVLAQRNSNDMKMLFSNVTFEIQKARHQQRQSITNMTEEQHQQPQNGSIFDIEDESPLASSHLELRNIEDVVDDDDETFIDASFVPQENSEFHDLVADVAGTSNVDVDDSASSNVANSVKTATISKVTRNEQILPDSDDYLDLDKNVSSEIDVAISQETPVVTKKKRKRKTSQMARNVPVADMNVSTLLDDTSTPDDKYDDIDPKSDLLPTATEVMYRSILRLVLSTLTAAIVCLLYLAMKRFVSIMLGLIVGSGIRTGVSTSTKSTLIPKP